MKFLGDLQGINGAVASSSASGGSASVSTYLANSVSQIFSFGSTSVLTFTGTGMPDTPVLDNLPVGYVATVVSKSPTEVVFSVTSPGVVSPLTMLTLNGHDLWGNGTTITFSTVASLPGWNNDPVALAGLGVGAQNGWKSVEFVELASPPSVNFAPDSTFQLSHSGASADYLVDIEIEVWATNSTANMYSVRIDMIAGGATINNNNFGTFSANGVRHTIAFSDTITFDAGDAFRLNSYVSGGWTMFYRTTKFDITPV